MPHGLHCRATTADGRPCSAPSNLLDPNSGLCASHDRERREELRQAACRGGAATARKRRGDGLDPEELGSRENVEDVRRWVRVIGQAVVSGRLGHKEAAALRARDVAATMVATSTREHLADVRAEVQRARKVRPVR